MVQKRRQQIITWVQQYFSDYFHYPIEHFTLDLDLRSDLQFTSQSLVDVGREINKSQFTPARVTPKEIVDCITIGDIVNLIWNLEQSK